MSGVEVGKNWKHCLRKGGRGAGKEGPLVRVSDLDVAKEIKDEGRPLHQSTGGKGEATPVPRGLKDAQREGVEQDGVGRDRHTPTRWNERLGEQSKPRGEGRATSHVSAAGM